MKRFISILLILATVMSCFMLTVSADDVIISDEGRLPFEDVKESHWFTPYIKFCYANGIIRGMTEYTVVPNGNLTRAQFVQMLATIDGANLTGYQVNGFDDVKPGYWYYGAVAWAYEKGIASGISNTKFGANDPVTREQMARFMMKYMEKKYTVEVADDSLDGFADVKNVSAWALDGIKYAVSAGLISGMQNGSDLCLAPKNTTTRAQAAVIFEAFMRNYFYAACEHSFSEVTCTEASVCASCGLVDGYAKGHSLSAYDCVTGGKCTVCEAEVEPSDILHSFMAATCSTPRTCRDCSATRGEAMAHSWEAATCTAPKTCTDCNVTEGSALGHTTTTGTCSRCGKVFATSDYDKMVNLIKTKGQYSEGNYVLVTEDSDSYTALVYVPSEDCIAVQNLRVFSNDHNDMTTLVVTRTGTVYEYLYMYANATEYIFAGYGKLDAATFTKNTKEGFSDYEGALKSSYTDYMNGALKEMLNDVNKILNPYGYSAKQLGFKVY